MLTCLLFCVILYLVRSTLNRRANMSGTYGNRAELRPTHRSMKRSGQRWLKTKPADDIDSILGYKQAPSPQRLPGLTSSKERRRPKNS